MNFESSIEVELVWIHECEIWTGGECRRAKSLDVHIRNSNNTAKWNIATGSGGWSEGEKFKT